MLVFTSIIGCLAICTLGGIIAWRAGCLGLIEYSFTGRINLASLGLCLVGTAIFAAGLCMMPLRLAVGVTA